MPNTPCLIGQAASAYVLGNNATGEDAEKVFALISSCGGFFSAPLRCGPMVLFPQQAWMLGDMLAFSHLRVPPSISSSITATHTLPAMPRTWLFHGKETNLVGSRVQGALNKDPVQSRCR